jgi:hypothetical protein
MPAEDRGGELAPIVDELLNTPASSIVAERRRLRVPPHTTTARRRKKKQERELPTPEKGVPLIEEGVAGIATCATPPP